MQNGATERQSVLQDCSLLVCIVQHGIVGLTLIESTVQPPCFLALFMHCGCFKDQTVTVDAIVQQNS